MSEDSDSEASTTSERATSFTLDGSTYTFENPVSLVLAAARQLNMAIGRDTRLLWVADEALLDEYDEEQAAALTSVPELPLSEEVAAHYADVFAQRSKPLRMKVDEEVKQAAALAIAKSEANAAKQAGSRRAKAKAKNRRDGRRKRLELRDARLSGITERYTEELAINISDDEDAAAPPSTSPGSRSSKGDDSPSSPAAKGTSPAQWPDAMPLDMMVPPSARMRGLSMPRIDSASIPLDQLDQSDEAVGGGAPPAAAPLSPQHEDTPARWPMVPPVDLQPARAEKAEEPAAGASEQGGGSGAAGGKRVFAIGERVAVDFDDEGWFPGVVESSRRSGGVMLWSVRLDDGEMADDVEGSEIRSDVAGPPAAERAARGEGDDGSSSGGKGGGSVCSRNTRSDALDGFNAVDGDARSQGSSDDVPQPTMEVRLSGSNVAWSFIDETEIGWSPPTTSLLERLNIQNGRQSPP